MSRYRVSMDIGGTFTDVVAYDEEAGTYAAGKVPTTPQRPDRGRPRRARRRDSPGDIAFTVHGTTQGLNAFLQRRGERVLLLTTAAPATSTTSPAATGRGSTTSTTASRSRWSRARTSSRSADGWTTPGAELEPLDEEDVRAAARARARRGLRRDRDRVPVRLPQPRARAARRRRSCARSSAASRSRCRTASRASGASTSARPRPCSTPTRRRSCAATSSASRASCRRAGSPVPLHVMQSSGGIITAASARDRPLQTLLSGPVGGTMGGVALAHVLDRPNLLCVDMGGTSFDVSLVVDGAARRSARDRARGLPDPDAGGEHPHGRRRRRLDRLRRGRRPARRARERRRGPGPGVLRTRRHAADGDRRERAARPHRRGELPRRHA